MGRGGVLVPSPDLHKLVSEDDDSALLELPPINGYQTSIPQSHELADTISQTRADKFYSKVLRVISEAVSK